MSTVPAGTQIPDAGSRIDVLSALPLAFGGETMAEFEKDDVLTGPDRIFPNVALTCRGGGLLIRE